MRCPSCGFDNPGDMRFCGQCGTALTPSAGSEERKFVTVLFADVVGSTGLSGRLDAEELRERMGRFFGIARDEIVQFGGTVEKFIGDAVMAVFGIPTMHEDDAARAVHAAVAIQTHVQPFVKVGIVPQIRIGISSGEVVANPKAATKGEFMVTGEVVNLAARLQQNAQPGQILVGGTTQAATQWAFDYRAVPPLLLKGKDERVAAYECTGIRTERLAPRGVPRVSSPLVGRQAEVAALLPSFERIRAGSGGIAVVIGDPGIGKTRLTTEIRRRVADWNVTWLVGRTLSISSAISYWPFLEIIKTACSITETDSQAGSWAKLEARVAALLPDQVEEVAPYLGTLLGLEIKDEWRDRVRYLDGEAMGRQIYRTSRLFFERLAQERPLVLVFEDLHWIDHSSSELLEHLLPLTRNVPILFCGLSRPDPASPAARLRETAGREFADRYTELLLQPLSPEHSAELVRNLLQVDELPAGIRQLILEKSEGNPLFVEEVLLALIDLGTMVRDSSGRWQVSAEIHRISIPDALRGVIIARLDRLDEDVKQVLKTAAVIGRNFFYRVLRAITEAGVELDRYLGELQQLELIHERRRLPELEYTFKHALTQEATYETILVRVRRELHRKVALTIEELFADRLEEVYGLLAYHYARAEEWEKAQDYLFKAGDRASRMAADAEALAYYRQAMSAYARAFGDRWDPRQRAILERKMGEALYRRGEHLQAREHYLYALSLLGRPFPTTRWGVRLAVVGEVLWQFAHLNLSEMVRRDKADVGKADAEERCRIYEAMGWIDYFVDIERVMLEALLVVNVAEYYGLATWIAMGTAGLGLICDHLPLHRQARRYHRRAVGMAEQIQHPLAVGLAYLAWAFHEKDVLGLWETAREHLQHSALVFREAGDLRRWGAVASMVAWVSRNRGEFGSSLAKCDEVLGVGEQAGDPQVLAWGLAMRGATLWPMGVYEEAVVHLERALKLFRDVPDYLWIVYTMSNLGMCYLRQGKHADALRALEEAQQVIVAQHVRGAERTYPLSPLAEVYFAQAEQLAGADRVVCLRKASQICRAALKQVRYDIEGLPGAHRVQGTYEWLMGRPALAQVRWKRSLAAAEMLGARYELGTTYLEMGLRLRTRDHLEHAEQIFTEIGARTDLSRVHDLLRKAS